MVIRSVKLNYLTHVILFLYYCVLTYQLPEQIVSPRLDPSWAGALSFFADSQKQFGSDIVFTFGPLGYLYSNVFSGYLLTEKLIFELLLKAIIALQLLAVTTRAGRLWGGLLVLTTFALSYQVKDYLFHFSITFALITIIETINRRRLMIGSLILLAILSLIKFSFLVMSALGIASIAIYLAILRDWKSLLLIISAYVTSILVLWTVSGQQVLSFQKYIITGMQITMGYPTGMFFAGQNAPVIIGLLMLAISALFLIGLLVYGKKNLATYFIILIICEGILLSWKHGFVRAEFHHIIQFYFYIMLVSITGFAVSKPAISSGRKYLTTIVFVQLLLLYTGMLLGGPSYWLNIFRPPAWNNFKSNLIALTKIPETLHSIDSQLQSAKEKHKLPRIQSTVGQDSIDVFGFEQGVALLNGFNYRPRPVFQSYSAYNRFLVQLNRQYYLSQDAPHYVLMKLQTIDDRIAIADDSAALEVILQNYAPVVAEQGYLLLRRIESLPVDAEPRLIRDTTGMFNEQIKLPAGEHRLWIEIEWDLDWRQRIQELLYKPEEVKIELTGADHKIRVHRLIQPLAAAGFLINPIIEDTFDVLALMTHKAPKLATSFRLLTDGKSLYDNFRYKLYLVSDIPTRSFSGNDALHELRYWMFSIAPLQVKANGIPGASDLRDANLFIAPAPSEILFDVPPESRMIEGQYGLLPKDESGLAMNSEAAFSIEYISKGQTPIKIFHRSLSPGKEFLPIGKQKFKVLLPRKPSAQIRLRATIPDNSANVSKRTYWSDIRFIE